MASKGAAAPVGYLWGRDLADRWHVVRAAESRDADGGYRRHVRSACGLWRSTTAGDPGRWAVLSRWLPGAGGPPPQLCAVCLGDVAAAARAVRRTAGQTPGAAQRRLFESWAGGVAR